MQPFRFQKAYSPVLLCNAHGGTLIPGDIPATMTEAGLQADANRMLIRLFDVAVLERAAAISSNISRHVIDLACAEDPATVVPAKTSAGDNIYVAGKSPDTAEINRRIVEYYRPFHEQLDSELNRIAQQYGRAVLVDVHSTNITTAPAISVGTAGSIDQSLKELLEDWQCAVKDDHCSEFQSLDKGLDDILGQHCQPAAVAGLRITVNQSEFVDSFDGEFDHESGRELIKSIESLMVAIAVWAQR